MLAECRCGRYLSSLLFSSYFVSICKCTYINSRYSRCAYSRCNSRYSRYVHTAMDTSAGVCSTCVSTAAVGTVVGSVDTCATSL